MASSTPECGVCDLRSISKPSTIWCFECDEGLCSECKDHHSLSKGTRKHRTVPISEYQKIPSDIVKITQNCDKHNEKYTFYCKKHVKIEEKPCNLVLMRKKNKQAQILLPHISARSVDKINLKLLQTINETGKYVWGCCMLPDGKIAFSSYTGRAVRVFNLNGTKDFEVNTRTWAFDVAYNSHDNTLAVTSGESDTKFITIIDIQSKQIKKTIPVNSEYYGIAVTNGKLICSVKGKGIQLINPNNNFTIDIVRDTIPRLCYVALFGDKIYHTNNQSNSVTCYDLQGTVQWTFKNDNVLKSPTGISVDNDGNVYVVGISSNNVVVISPDGQQYKELATASDGFFNSFSLDYNRSTNQLLVSNCSDKACTFTLI